MPITNHWSLTLLLLVFLPALAQAASPTLPLRVEVVEGEVRYSDGAEVKVVTGGSAFVPGTQLRTGTDGRVELSGKSLSKLSLGPSAELLLHSVEREALRARLSRGALRIDAGPSKGHRAGDVRLNVGELRLRVADAAIWAEQADDQVQVCLIRGSAEVQFPDRAGRLELPGQCVRHLGVESSWSVVPMEILVQRIAAVAIQSAVPESNAPAPAPQPAPAVIAEPAPVAPAPAARIAVAAAPVAATPDPVVPPPEPAAVPAPPAAPTAATAAAPDLRRWSVVLHSFPLREAADQAAAVLRAKGIEAEVREYVRGERRGYRVGFGRFDTIEQTDAALKTLQVRHPGLPGWPAKY